MVRRYHTTSFSKVVLDSPTKHAYYNHKTKDVLMEKVLKQARGGVADRQSSEIEITSEQPAAADLLQQIQELKAEKYASIKDALTKINEEFDPKILELEKEYALFITLAG
jgi:DNA-directed RNA polymerase subunit F